MYECVFSIGLHVFCCLTVVLNPSMLGYKSDYPKTLFDCLSKFTVVCTQDTSVMHL